MIIKVEIFKLGTLKTKTFETKKDAIKFIEEE